MPFLDATVDEIFEMIYKKKLQSTIEIRPYNAEQTKNMRDLNPQGMELFTILVENLNFWRKNSNFFFK